MLQSPVAGFMSGTVHAFPNRLLRKMRSKIDYAPRLHGRYLTSTLLRAAALRIRRAFPTVGKAFGSIFVSILPPKFQGFIYCSFHMVTVASSCDPLAVPYPLLMGRAFYLLRGRDRHKKRQIPYP